MLAAKHNINLYAAILLTLLIPYKLFIPPVIALWFLYQLSQFKTISWKGYFSNFWLLIPLCFFLLHAVAYLFSSNKHEALFAIEVKLSFLFLPFLFFNSSFGKKEFSTISYAFVLSCLVAVLICTINSVIHYFSQGDLLTYNSYSLFQHPSYFAMYLVFSLIVILIIELEFIKSKLFSITLKILAAAIIVIGIVLSSSKMGLLSLGLLIPCILFYKLLKSKKYVLTAVLAIGFVVSGIVVFNLDFMPVERLKSAFKFYNSNQATDKTTTESNAVRVLVWNEAIELIKEKPLLGYSPADANDVLYAAYEKAGLTGALKEHLNAHNQFLQTSIGLGLFGAVLLLLQTLGVLIVGFVRKNIWALLFGILVIVNFLVESMLQTEAGNLFFVFFYCLIIAAKKTELSNVS